MRAAAGPRGCRPSAPRPARRRGSRGARRARARYGSSRSRGRTRSILLTAAIAGRPELRDALEHQLVLRGPAQRLDHQHHEVGILERGGRGAVHRLVERARSPAVQARACRRTRSARCGRFTMPRMRWRVVCGRGVTMLSFCPTSALSSVDLPTFGRPTRAAKPLRKSGAGSLDCGLSVAARSPPACGSAASCSARRRLEPLPSARSSQRRHLAADVEDLRVGLALDALHRVARQRKTARLQVLLQARLGILERLGRRQRRDARLEQPRDDRRAPPRARRRGRAPRTAPRRHPPGSTGGGSRRS